LKVVASLGGDDFSAETFSSLIADKDRFDNLTSSVNNLYKDGVINGVEIDWEWPVKEGGKKDRVKLIRYARVSWVIGSWTSQCCPTRVLPSRVDWAFSR